MKRQRLIIRVPKIIIAVIVRLVLEILERVAGLLAFIYSLFACFYYDIFNFVKRRANIGAAANFLMDSSIADDAAWNVKGREAWNILFIKKGGYKFGNRKDTISYVLGINYRLKTLTKTGLLLSRILNKLDKNHLEKAIQSQQQKTKLTAL